MIKKRQKCRNNTKTISSLMLIAEKLLLFVKVSREQQTHIQTIRKS